MAIADGDSWLPRIPQTRSGRELERKALRIRKFAGVDDNSPINPFELATQLHVIVVSLDDLPELSPEVRDHLVNKDSDGWSGGATTPLADGSRVVVLNPTHSRRRRAATLMEELSHIVLGHTADRLGISDEDGKSRDYDREREREAYGVGAAVLLPYVALKRRLERGIDPKVIAREFGVSIELVKYRAKITGLWRVWKERYDYQ